MEHECTIGLWSDYDYSPLVTLSDLVELQPQTVYTMAMLTDNRYNTCLRRFTINRQESPRTLVVG